MDILEDNKQRIMKIYLVITAFTLCCSGCSQEIENIPLPNTNMGRYSISLIEKNGWESYYNDNKKILED